MSIRLKSVSILANRDRWACGGAVVDLHSLSKLGSRTLLKSPSDTTGVEGYSAIKSNPIDRIAELNGGGT